MNWYDKHENLVGLAYYLQENDLILGEDWPLFIEKPWKWEPEYRQMLDNNKTIA